MVWSTVTASTVMMLPALEITECDFRNGCSFLAGMENSDGEMLETLAERGF